VTQCNRCHYNASGFCRHYRRPVPRDGPYLNWKFCLQQLDKPMVKHHVFPKGELMRLKLDGRWETYIWRKKHEKNERNPEITERKS
jgi:hypothetical protein